MSARFQTPAPSLHERVLGAVYGHLVGDAFGVPYEFSQPEELPAEPTWRGWGTWNQPPGTWSDDGALMLCGLASLVEHDGFAPDDVAARYVRCFDHGEHWADGRVFDQGPTTAAAVARLRDGTPPLEAGGTLESANGNGSLMRCLPFAVWAHTTPPADLAALAHDVSRLTHGHARSQVCCALYALGLAALLAGAAPAAARDDALERLEGIYRSDAAAYQRHLAELALIHAYRRRTGGGYVVDCYHSAWEAVCAADGYAAAVTRAVGYGNDTDTTAAVAGSLAGAAWGIGALPEPWRGELRLQPEQHRLIERFAERVAARTG